MYPENDCAPIARGMPVARTRATSLLELYGSQTKSAVAASNSGSGSADAGAEVPSPVRLRVALDLLEPLAAGSTKVRLVKRLSGSRFVIDNVQVGL